MQRKWWPIGQYELRGTLFLADIKVLIDSEEPVGRPFVCSVLGLFPSSSVYWLTYYKSKPGSIVFI